MNATDRVAGYVANLKFEDIAPEAVSRCKEIILDELGVLIRASRSKGSAQIIVDFVSRYGGKPTCTVIGSSLKVDPVSAALANGTMGHDIIELDDTHGPSYTHAAAVIIPASLAIAETEKCTGMAFMTAVVAAYDIEGRIGIAFGRGPVARGFHYTSVAGCFGATVAASKLLKLSKEQVLYAIGLAASQACGLTTFNDEAMHMSKSLQAGVAARNGVTAALLAKIGYIAPPQVLDGRNNVLNAFSGEGNYAALTEELGSRFEVMRTGFKWSSSCRVNHAPLEAFLKIIDEHKLRPDDIQQVTVRLGLGQAPAVDGNPLITHNAQGVLAMAAFDRKKVSVMVPYADSKVDPEVSALAKRIRVVADPEIQKLLSTDRAWASIVEVETRDGRRFSAQVNDPKGEPTNPFTKQEFEDKFMDLAVPVIGDEKARQIVKMVDRLEQLDDIMNLTALLKP